MVWSLHVSAPQDLRDHYSSTKATSSAQLPTGNTSRHIHHNDHLSQPESVSKYNLKVSLTLDLKALFSAFIHALRKNYLVV